MLRVTFEERCSPNNTPTGYETPAIEGRMLKPWYGLEISY
jgi:hypothetical protein